MLVRAGRAPPTEPEEAADHVREAGESQSLQPDATNQFRTRAAITIAVLGMLLAIASLGGEGALKQTLNATVWASDTYAFYQAKNIRQTATMLAADALESTLRLHADAMNSAQRQDLERRLADYRVEIARYESEPAPEDPGNPLK